MPSIFNDLLGADWLPATFTPAVTPAINVKEGKEAYTVEVAAPGMTKEDFSVHINGQNDLVITMERKDKNCACDEKSATTCVANFRTPSFSRPWFCPTT